MARSLATMLPSLWQTKIKNVDPDISWPDFLAAEREWIENETSRRIDALRRSGATPHGDLADLESPADTWQETPLHIPDEDLLNEALQLLVSTHPDLTPDRLDIV